MHCRIFLVKWANSCFDISNRHLRCNVFGNVVDLEVSDAALVVVSTLDAANLGQVRMTAKEKWSSGVQLCVLVSKADVGLR